MEDQTQIPYLYLLQQLRWNKEVANDTLTTLETVQIQQVLPGARCRFPTPHIEETQAAET
jgi:hypothetical protein